MRTPTDSEIPARPPVQDPARVDLSRRKLGVGLGVSAVFTLASRPVLAQQCLSASAAASGNLSTHGAVPTCSGLTPGEWVALAQNTNPTDPNSPTQNGFPGGNVNFHAPALFASGSRADWGSSTRLYEVMAGGTNTPGTTTPSSQGGFLGSRGADNASAATSIIAPPTGPNPISMEFAATLLNIRDGRIPNSVLDETKLIGMWNEWLTTGVYAPMAGVAWNADQIVIYLRTLHGA